MNLRAQILLLGTAGVAIIGAIYLVSVQFEERSQRRADEFTTLTTLTARVSESLLQGRELATQFLQKPDEKKIAAHTAVVELATQSLAEIERIAAALPDDDPLRQATSFRAAINNYMIRFSNVVAAQKVIGFNENDGLQGKLRTAVHTVETRLKEHDEPRLTVLMLMMRRHEKDFMLRGDEKYGDDLNTRVDEFNAELANSGLAEDARAEIKKLVEAYKMSFMGYVAGQSTLTDEATDLAQIYERMKPTIIGVRKAAEQRLQSVRADLATVQHYVFWSICLTVVAVAMGALMFGRWISTPLIRIAGSMDLLSRGDLDTPIQPIARGDEIGKISGALQVFHQKLLDNRRLEAEQGEAQALAEAERRTSRLQVADQFEQAVSQIVRAVSTASAEIEAASGSLTKTAETTQELSTTVAAAAGQSSANVQSAAAASEQMVSSVSEISRQVQTSLEVARAAVLQADETNARIAKLSQSADRISDVVKTISAVASQTNLLALNATIEAARAGEAGKGFAVVATEVKALASPTAHATEQISAQISEMQAATQHSVDAIKEIGSTISHISEISSSIALSVEQQGAATQEIALNVQQAAAGAAQVTGSIAEVNRGATETGSAAGQVHGAARELLGESNHLRDEVEKFLATVRAA